MGFFDRNRKSLEALGIDPVRLPEGQYHTDRFPVLHVGDVPDITPATCSLRLFGEIENHSTLSLQDIQALPNVDVTTDIHCVTKWSKFDTVWRGVRFRDIVELAQPHASVQHIIQHAVYGYTTNLPLEDYLGDNALLTWQFDGEPLEAIHGGPLRVLVPHLYFWKSAKWLEGLEFSSVDKPGFWERNGYHNYGDPFREQRFTND